MKKIVLAIFLAIIVMAVADSVRAGERLAVSEQEWVEIEAIAKAAYPLGANVEMAIKEPWLAFYIIVEFYTLDSRQDIELHVFPVHAYAKIHRVGGENIC